MMAAAEQISFNFFIFHLLARLEMQLCCLADLERSVLIQNVQSLWCCGGKRDPPAHASKKFVLTHNWRSVEREHFSGERSAANTQSQPSDDCSALAAAFLEVSGHKGYLLEFERYIAKEGEIFEIRAITHERLF
jgi:hypothetical protein